MGRNPYHPTAGYNRPAPTIVKRPITILKPQKGRSNDAGRRDRRRASACETTREHVRAARNTRPAARSVRRKPRGSAAPTLVAQNAAVRRRPASGNIPPDA
jgi:hypothetical protein